MFLEVKEMYNKTINVCINSEELPEEDLGKVMCHVEIMVDRSFMVHLTGHIFNDKKAKTKKVDVHVNCEYEIEKENKHNFIHNIISNDVMLKHTKLESKYFWKLRRKIEEIVTTLNYRQIYYEYLTGKVK